MPARIDASRWPAPWAGATRACALGVILITRLVVGEAAFGEWGWRVPFLVSIVLVLLSLYIRMSMRESPLFAS